MLRTTWRYSQKDCTLHRHRCEIFKSRSLRYITITVCRTVHSFICFLQDALLDRSVRGRKRVQIQEEVKPGRGQGSDPLGPSPVEEGVKTAVGISHDARCRHHQFAIVMKPYGTQWWLKTSADEKWICSPNMIVSSMIDIILALAEAESGLHEAFRETLPVRALISVSQQFLISITPTVHSVNLF